MFREITRKKKNSTVFEFEYDRIYYPDRQYIIPRRATIGKQWSDDPDRMIPNENFLKCLPEGQLPMEKDTLLRRNTQKAGDFIALAAKR